MLLKVTFRFGLSVSFRPKFMLKLSIIFTGFSVFSVVVVNLSLSTIPKVGLAFFLVPLSLGEGLKVMVIGFDIRLSDGFTVVVVVFVFFLRPNNFFFFLVWRTRFGEDAKGFGTPGGRFSNPKSSKEIPGGRSSRPKSSKIPSGKSKPNGNSALLLSGFGVDSRFSLGLPRPKSLNDTPGGRSNAGNPGILATTGSSGVEVTDVPRLSSEGFCCGSVIPKSDKETPGGSSNAGKPGIFAVTELPLDDDGVVVLCGGGVGLLGGEFAGGSSRPKSDKETPGGSSKAGNPGMFAVTPFPFEDVVVVCGGGVGPFVVGLCVGLR